MYIFIPEMYIYIYIFIQRRWLLEKYELCIFIPEMYIYNPEIYINAF